MSSTKWHCHDCFHNDVCGNASIYNDVVMCKQFKPHSEVLSGPAYKVVCDELDRLQTEVKQLKVDNTSKHYRIKDLEGELELLRIIKQTLEMQSGMKFDF